MEPDRSEILNALKQIALSKPNDAVALALAPQELHVESLDLWCVSEFKVSSAGTVEVKFVDRAKLLDLLLERAGSGGDGLDALLAAMNSTGK